MLVPSFSKRDSSQRTSHVGSLVSSRKRHPLGIDLSDASARKLTILRAAPNRDVIDGSEAVEAVERFELRGLSDVEATPNAGQVFEPGKAQEGGADDFDGAIYLAQCMQSDSWSAGTSERYSPSS